MIQEFTSSRSNSVQQIKREAGADWSVYGCQCFPLFKTDSRCLPLSAQDSRGLNATRSCVSQSCDLLSLGHAQLNTLHGSSLDLLGLSSLLT